MAVTVDPYKTNKPWLGVTVAGGITRTLADLFSDSISVKNYFKPGYQLDRALQDAIDDQYARSPAGAAIFVPPGAYDWEMVEGAVVVPSNFTIWAIPGTTKIVPDLTTLALASTFTFPNFTNCMIGAGNPTTRGRSGNPSAGSVDPASITNNISLIGLGIDNSAYFDAGRVQITAGKFLSALELYFCHRAAIEHCYVYGMPNSGLNFGAGHRNARMANNRVERCGYLCSSNGTRNGISTTGWVDLTSEAMSSNSIEIVNNTSNYNWQEGIQHSSTRGAIITGNIMLGNHEYGLEGENTNSDASKNAAGVGYEVPAHVIIANNYIDGRDDIDGVKGTGGINWGSGNQGTIKCIGNTVRHIDNSASTSPSGTGSGPYVTYTSGSGINCFQTNDGTVTIQDNTLEDITPGTTGQVIACGATFAYVNKNKIINCAATSTAIGLFAPNGVKVLDYGDNEVIGGCKRYSDLTVDAGSGNTVAVDLISFNGAKLDGCTDSAFVMRLPHNATIKRLTMDDMELMDINSAGSSSAGIIRFTGGLAGGFSTTITDMTMDNTFASASGATPYPIVFDATTTINDACVTNLRVNNSRFKGFTNTSLLFATAKVANLFANRNGYPDQPNIIIKTTSGTVVMGDDTEAVIINKDTPAATVVRLPGFCTIGKPHVIADGANNAGTFNITIQLADTVTTFDIINQNGGARTVIPLKADGTSWIIVA